jgi:hypothetical protein
MATELFSQELGPTPLDDLGNPLAIPRLGLRHIGDLKEALVGQRHSAAADVLALLCPGKPFGRLPCRVCCLSPSFPRPLR